MSWKGRSRRNGLAAVISLSAISSCFMPAAWPVIAESQPAAAAHPLKSYKSEPDDASAYPYYDARIENRPLCGGRA